MIRRGGVQDHRITMRRTRGSLELGMGTGTGASWCYMSSLDQIGGVSCLSISHLRLGQSLPLTEAAGWWD